MQCFLDMDGVLADFVTGVCEVHGRPDPYADTCNHGVWDMEKVWGISATQFWKPLNSHGYEFWSGLAKTAEADWLVELVGSRYGFENIAILTAPSLDSGCVPGKRDWVKMHYPHLQKQILYGSAKRFLAGPNKILIDDKDSNVGEFREYGGTGILVPRLWNSEYTLVDSSRHVVEGRLNSLWTSNSTYQTN